MTAKPRGRARLTNDPMRVRAPGHTARGKRLRDLYKAFAAKIAADDVSQAAALRAAELTAATEDLRRQIMDADLSQADDAKFATQAKLAEQLTRLENSLDRAERRLAKLVGDAPEVDETTSSSSNWPPAIEPHRVNRQMFAKYRNDERCLYDSYFSAQQIAQNPRNAPQLRKAT